MFVKMSQSQYLKYLAAVPYDSQLITVGLPVSNCRSFLILIVYNVTSDALKVWWHFYFNANLSQSLTMTEF